MATVASSRYQSYQDMLDKGQHNEDMGYREKKKLIQQIDQLDTKDHIGILKIIMDSTDKKIYTVNNYGTYIDLNDLENQALWKIAYHVQLCLENIEREKELSEAEKRYNEDRSNLEETMRTKSKLKLTSLNLAATQKKEKRRRKLTDDLSNDNNSDSDSEDEDDDDDDDDEDEFETDNKIGIQETDSDLPQPENFSLEDSETAFGEVSE